MDMEPKYEKRINPPKLINDHFQNYKTYGIPKAQLIIADIPYNIGKDAYGSNPAWYVDGDGRMVFNCMDWKKDTTTPKIHPTQKPIPVLQNLIRIFTDEGDVVIDPCAGSGSTLLAAYKMNRNAIGFEIKKNFFKDANEKILSNIQKQLL